MKIFTALHFVVCSLLIAGCTQHPCRYAAITDANSPEQKQQSLLTSSSQAYLDRLTASSSVWKERDRAKQSQYLVQLWQKLLALTATQRQNLVSQAVDDNQRGWLRLTRITKQTGSSSQMQQQLQQWQQDFPGHPAQLLLTNVTKSQAFLPNSPQKIALLLPLNGALGKQGQAIRNGFLAAFYQAKSAGYAPQIAVYDTSQDDVITLYQKAVQEQAQIVIGPLLKNNIAHLIATQRLNVPTIALNTIPTQKAIPHLYQFGLAPEDEAKQVAQRLWNKQYQRLVIIKPENAWGQRVQQSFIETWNKLGGQVSATLDYKARNALASQLRELFNLDASATRARHLRWALHTKLRFTPRRRKDFDAIFLVAEPNLGRQIMPMLRFFYVNDVPIYSISKIYRGHQNQRLDRDLNGVIFDDIPWLLSKPDALPSEIQTLKKSITITWPESFKKYPRLYALGNDAFHLVSEFNKFSLMPNVGINGATGVLYLQPNGQIYRQLTFCKIVNGKPQCIECANNT